MHRSPLEEAHEALGARMVPFAGWRMPVQYGSILEEVRTVRERVGLFDLSHMGRFRVSGPEATEALQKVLTNDVAAIKKGAIRYALITKEDGGVLDDVLCYRDPERGDELFLVVNAANRERDLEWLRTMTGGMEARIEDRTFELAMIALQGRASLQALSGISGNLDLEGLGYYKWTRGEVAGVPCEVSRTGYTGEDGFEIYYPADQAVKVWEAVLEAGKEFGIRPIGLGARDTLRLEAGMALYGHELSEEINPLEAGLSWAVRLKTDFIGRDALLEVKEKGPARKLVGLVTSGKRVPRQGYPVLLEDTEVGFVASGNYSPTLDRNIATAFVRASLAEAGASLAVQARKDRLDAEVVPLPFYKRPY